MPNSIASTIPYIVLFSHFFLVVIVAALISRASWGKGLSVWLGKNALWLSFIVGLAAVAGSLFYSEVMGYEPCVLCWWQRVFLYPTAIIYGIALWKQRPFPHVYTIPLTILASIVAMYQSYVYWGGSSILPCTAVGGSCSKVYVMAFGYITIPTMSLTIALYTLVLAWSYRIYRNENSNA